MSVRQRRGRKPSPRPISSGNPTCAWMVCRVTVGSDLGCMEPNGRLDGLHDCRRPAGPPRTLGWFVGPREIKEMKTLILFTQISQTMLQVALKEIWRNGENCLVVDTDDSMHAILEQHA